MPLAFSVSITILLPQCKVEFMANAFIRFTCTCIAGHQTNIGAENSKGSGDKQAMQLFFEEFGRK